ncbi:ATP-binding protein [Candidatus Woesearchaeota archaeon]|nr:ATP-binding protein [Candidatus Woesearchaeota archaeon]
MVFKKIDNESQAALQSIEKFADKKRFKLIKKLLKQKRIEIYQKGFNTTLVNGMKYPQINAGEGVDADDINKEIEDSVKQQVYTEFSKKAFETISELIAPNISGMEHIKKAAALQLFSKQPVHILMIGDPGTGKTDILRSVAELSPVSSFGLGSGTSGAGLVVTAKGNEVIKGLLPQADNGLCAIDELNLMKKEDYAGLYNAMEKGFVTYDKAGQHVKFDARIKLIATANPKHDRFTGSSVDELKNELPFDSALLTRFHLVFMLKKHDIEQFKEIAKSIISNEDNNIKNGDITFIKEYISHIQSQEDVDFPKEYQQQIIEFIEEIKKNEQNYLMEISPRFIVGIMRLCKALTRAEGRYEIEEEDIKKIKSMVKESLKIS